MEKKIKIKKIADYLFFNMIVDAETARMISDKIYEIEGRKK